MVVGQRAKATKGFNWPGVKAGKVSLLVLGHSIGVLFPLTFFPMGVWGGNTIYFYLLCAVVQSAVLFYGKDLFEQTKSPYLWSLVTYFVTAAVIGGIVFAAGVKEIWFHDGSCLPSGGPTITLFALFALEFLPLALIISPLWMAIRWLENMVQLMWFRKKHLKALKV